MLLEGIEKLKKTQDEFLKNGGGTQEAQCESDMLIIALFMQQSIDIFKEIANYQKGIVKAQKNIIAGQNKLEKRIRRLEENESYYLEKISKERRQ